MKKLLGILLSLCLLLGCCAGFAEGAEEADWTAAEYAAHAAISYELAKDYTGKTVILHSNDVHGQIDGYAYIAGLREYFKSLGAEVILADSGDVLDHPYLPQMQAFTNCIIDNKPMPLTSFADAYETHRAIFAADLSAKLGRPVKMSELL